MRSAICALIVIAIALVATAGYLGRKKRDDFKKEVAQIKKDYFLGTSPPIPGPYLTNAKASKLKFKVIPIGTFRWARLSENGNLLLSESKPNPKLNERLFHEQSFRVVSSDNAMRLIDDASTVFMSTSGDIYKTRVTRQSPPQYSELELPNGKLVRIDDYMYELAENHDQFVGSQGFLYRDGHGKQVTYLDFSLKQQGVPVPDGWGVAFWTQSSQLGEIGYAMKIDDNFSKQLAFLKDGNLRLEPVPFVAAFCREKAGGRNLAISVGRELHERVPYLRTGVGEFVRLGVPKGTVLAEVMAINNRGEYILMAEEPCLHTSKHPVVPWDTHYYFVSNRSAYDLDEIVTNVLPSESRASVSYELLDDNGDLVVTGDQSSYLLRRIR